MKINNYLRLAVIILLYACSAAEQSVSEKANTSPEIYIFDDVEKTNLQIDSLVAPEKKSNSREAIEVAENPQVDPTKVIDTNYCYIVQLGAFSSNERAQDFVRNNQSKTEIPLKVNYNPNTKFYVVQSSQFEKIEEAEKYKNRIVQIPVFKDAFIITMEQ